MRCELAQPRDCAQGANLAERIGRSGSSVWVGSFEQACERFGRVDRF